MTWKWLVDFLWLRNCQLQLSTQTSKLQKERRTTKDVECEWWAWWLIDDRLLFGMHLNICWDFIIVDPKTSYFLWHYCRHYCCRKYLYSAIGCMLHYKVNWIFHHHNFEIRHSIFKKQPFDFLRKKLLTIF